MTTRHSKPNPFLEVRTHIVDTMPTTCGLCAGYEKEEWRSKQLANHIMEWLPEFALTTSECAGINQATAVDFLRRAAQTVYQTDKFSKRGEFGELILHAVIRQVHDSLPAISKIYYKTAANDTVKGFDAVHVVGPTDDLELWLGEAKFYNEINRAISDVTKELEVHLGADYLRSEFLLIKGKIDESWPQAEALRKLISANTSLDIIFKRICIPVLLTYDSNCISRHKECTVEYIADFEKEIAEYSKKFADSIAVKGLPKQVRIHLFLLPLHEKKALIKALDEKLKVWQKI